MTTFPAFTSTLTNGRQLEIKVPEVFDAKSLIDFCNRVGGETEFLTFGANEFHISLLAEENFIADVRVKNQDVLLMGTVSRTIVSSLSIIRTMDRSRLEHVGELGISVAKSYWGLGVGRKMCEVALGLAKERGVTKVNLKVREDNGRAIRLYEQLGFKQEGLSTRAYRVAGKYFSNVLMGLDL